MNRPILGTLFALACVSILVLSPVPANAVQIHKHVTAHKQISLGDRGVVSVPVERTVVVDVAPLDSDQDGCPDGADNYNGPGCNAPAPTPAAQSSMSVAPSTPTTTSVPAASGGYSIPDYIVQCESGGSYTAQNASGAYGAYQIMPSTSAAYGCDMSSPAGQDACAAKIYADVGSSAWSCG